LEALALNDPTEGMVLGVDEEGVLIVVAEAELEMDVARELELAIVVGAEVEVGFA